DDVAGILGGMVEVDVQITFRMQGEIDEAVLGELLEHMIEKADTGRDLCDPGTVEIDAAGNPSLLGIALDRRHPHHALLEGRARGDGVEPPLARGSHYGPGTHVPAAPTFALA